MTALRIAYVLGTTAGGTGAHVAMLARGCLQAGFTVSAFGPEETRDLFSRRPGAGPGGGQSAAATARPHGGDTAGVAFEVVQVAERPRPVRDLAAVLRLSRLLARARPDVVHAHGLRAGAVATLALGSARRRGPALVVTVHNGPPDGAAARAVYRALERLVARRADTVACVSDDLAERMRRRGARRTERAVVPAPLAEPPSAQAIEQARTDLDAGGRPVVLAVGRLTGQKGFDSLLAAAARWQDRSPQPLLAIAGEGPLAAVLASSAAGAGLAVRFLGRRTDVRALLAAADVLAAPSRWEGQPLLLQEALQAGTPIVASRVGGVPRLTGGDAALLVPPEDPAELAAAVLRVLDDRGLARRLSAAALVRAAGLPSQHDAVQAAVELYRAVAPADRMV